MEDRVCGYSVGFQVKDAAWIDEGGERPVMLVRELVSLNDEPVEVLVPRPIAGVGSDGEYHVGVLVNPGVVRRAMWLTDRREMQRMGVRNL